MKLKTIVAILAVAMCVASQARAQMQGGGITPGGGMGTPDPLGAAESGPPPERPAQALLDPEAKAEDLRLNGKCQEAIPIFRQLAALGAGYEIAQYNLGLCLFDASTAEPNADRAALLREEAAAYIIKAANYGFPNAQSSLVAMYLDGVGVTRDPVTAGMWALIYHSNAKRMAISLPDISPNLRARLEGVLADKGLQEARARADAWSQQAQ